MRKTTRRMELDENFNVHFITVPNPWYREPEKTMAGSYDHITDEDGALIEPMEVYGRIESGGDTYECIEQLYGMIWFLANEIVTYVEYDNDKSNEARMLSEVIAAARNYEEGLKASPTERYKEFDEGSYKGKSIAQIIHDYAVVRGDLSEPYARKQLADIIEHRIKKAKEQSVD